MVLFLQLLCVLVAVKNTIAHDPIHQALMTSRNNETVLVVNAVPVQDQTDDTFWNRLTSGWAHRNTAEDAVEHDATEARESAREEIPKEMDTTTDKIVPMDIPQEREPRISEKGNFLDIIDAKTIIDALWADSSSQAQARSSGAADSNNAESVYLGPLRVDINDEALHVDQITGSLDVSSAEAALQEADPQTKTPVAEALDPALHKHITETAADDKDLPKNNSTTEAGTSSAGPAEVDEGSAVPEGRRASLAYTIRPFSFLEGESSEEQATQLSKSDPSLETRDPFNGHLTDDSVIEFSIKPTAVEDGGYFDPAEFGLDFSSVKDKPRSPDSNRIDNTQLPYLGTTTRNRSPVSHRNWNRFWADRTTHEGLEPLYRTQYSATSSPATVGPNSLEQAIARALEGQSVLRSGMGDFDVLVTPADRAMVRSVIETRALCNLWAQSGACSCRMRICRRWTAYVRRTCPEVCMEEENTASTLQQRTLGGAPSLSDLIRSLPKPALTLLQQVFSAPGINIRARCKVAGSLLGRVRCRASTPYVAHPFFCECFYSCEGSRKNLHVCPAGKHYSTDENAKLCVEPARARCQARKPFDFL